jgi:hypothetical protein
MEQTLAFRSGFSAFYLNAFRFFVAKPARPKVISGERRG